MHHLQLEKEAQTMQTDAILMSAVILFTSAPCLQSQQVKSDNKGGCREFALLCNSGKKKAILDNCNLTRYHHYLGTAANDFLFEVDKRKQLASLKGQWKSKTGHCYIEAILDKNSEFLFIRFGPKRSLLVGQVKDKGWEEFNDVMRSYESRPDGMQMLMDLSGLKICSHLSLNDTATGFQKRVLARFADRAAIAFMPMERFTGLKFRLVEFRTDDAQLAEMQPNWLQNTISTDIFQVLKQSTTMPLTLWVYKCPATAGIDDLPCNSEVFVYVYLRQWINNTRMSVQYDDYFDDSDWREVYLASDIPLILLTTVTSTYIAIHLTCITWMGLANASGKSEA